jgi:hypothetical protein
LSVYIFIMIEFYNVKKKEKVSIDESKVDGKVIEKVTKTGKQSTRYCLKAVDEDGTKLTKFCSKADYDKITGQS